MSKHVFQSSDRMAPYRLPEAQKKSLKLKVSSLLTSEQGNRPRPSHQYRNLW